MPQTDAATSSAAGCREIARPGSLWTAYPRIIARLRRSARRGAEVRNWRRASLPNARNRRANRRRVSKPGLQRRAPPALMDRVGCRCRGAIPVREHEAVLSVRASSRAHRRMKVTVHRAVGGVAHVHVRRGSTGSRKAFLVGTRPQSGSGARTVRGKEEREERRRTWIRTARAW